MIRTIPSCERSLVAGPAQLIVIPANTPTDIIPDQVVEPKNVEVAARYIQNVGAEDLFVSFGVDSSAAAYHNKLVENVQMNCGSRLRVSGYSVAGTTVAVLVFYRANGNNATV